jgi:hypothetical protein
MLSLSIGFGRVYLLRRPAASATARIMGVEAVSPEPIPDLVGRGERRSTSTQGQGKRSINCART